MCLAVPAEVLYIKDGVATCRLGESAGTFQASLMLLPEPPAVGDYLIVHAGFAIHILDAAAAGETLRLLRAAVRAVDAAEAATPGERACAAAVG